MDASWIQQNSPAPHPHSLWSQREPAEAVAGGVEGRCWENFWGPDELAKKRSALWDGPD